MIQPKTDIRGYTWSMIKNMEQLYHHLARGFDAYEEDLLNFMYGLNFFNTLKSRFLFELLLCASAAHCNALNLGVCETSAKKTRELSNHFML